MLLAFYVSATCAATTFRARLQDRLVDMTGSERGGVAAEYAILIALIAVVMAAGAALLGTAILNKLNGAAACVNAAPC
jgi:Flp pilus assembly pilin Flp